MAHIFETTYSGYEIVGYRCLDCDLRFAESADADAHWLESMTAFERAAYEQREKERNSHSWTTFDGEDWSCFYCDSKTGNGMCPGAGPQDPDEFWSLASTTEREADQIIHPGTYEAEAEDPF